MTTAEARTILRGSVEYLDVSITADVELATQPVRISFDRVTWVECEWQGEPGTTRTASVLGTDANLPDRSSEVFVQVTDNPEAPIISAGILHRA